MTKNIENTCIAGNTYFENKVGRCARTIERWLKAFIDCGCLNVHLVYDGKRVAKRLITISTEVLKNTAKFVSTKLTLKDFKEICKRIKNDATHFHFSSKNDAVFSCDKEAFCQSNVGYNYILGIYKDDILLRNISQKEKVSKKSRPKNYDELLKFWVGKNLEESAKADIWRKNKR